MLLVRARGLAAKKQVLPKKIWNIMTHLGRKEECLALHNYLHFEALKGTLKRVFRHSSLTAKILPPLDKTRYILP